MAASEALHHRGRDAVRELVVAEAQRVDLPELAHDGARQDGNLVEACVELLQLRQLAELGRQRLQRVPRDRQFG